jgi:uncharacterized protein YbjT (DUF2867 family)
MKLTVLGATGGVGRLAVRQALDAGHDVTAVVRDPARLPVSGPADALRLVTVRDITDPAALIPALTGADAVVSALGAAGNKQAKAAPIAGSAMRAIVRAMGDTGVGRIAAVSAAPVGPTASEEALVTRVLVFPLLHRFLRDLYADLAEMEHVLEASALRWTVLHPPMLVDRPFTGSYRRVIGGNVIGGRTIARADVADALLCCLSNEGTVNRVVGVAA